MLLAVDSSTQIVGLAFYDGHQVVGEMIWRSQNHHTVELAPAINDLMKRCGLENQDLKGFAVALGPGSFTSLRIGLAIVKGMALSLHLPIVGIPTHDILATAQPARDIPMAAVIQAGRGRVAVRWYQYQSTGWKSTQEAEVMTLSELSEKIQSPTYVCGEIAYEHRQILSRNRRNVIFASPVHSVRRPSHLAAMAWKRLKTGHLDDIVSLSPIYLHIANPIPDV